MSADYLPKVDLGLTVYIFSPQYACQSCHHPVSLFLKYSGHCLRHLLSILNSSDRFEDKNVFFFFFLKVSHTLPKPDPVKC